MHAHTILLVTLPPWIFVIDDSSLDKVRLRLVLPTRGQVQIGAAGAATYVMYVRAPSLLVLLSVYVLIITLVDVLHLDVREILLLVFKAAHLSCPVPNVGFDLRLDVLALLLLGVLLFPLAA
jgi:hypothetical protein